ncbi:hypothetical protein [Butyrivibrio hungatei]|uniref:Uncharacterized protein n=1 Tax=Butyrivibrio hungatei TaxID=185008 RepID=A0A1D9P5K8_9FIRM|nr:hypothetical protein [Butyrivibrio hungatei]AOZ97829.1 hypothetical protein bhn_II030 [Butyrivibrio hungatei]
MKYIFDSKEVSNICSLIATVKEKDTKVMLVLGSRDLGANILGGVRVTTDVEQIQYQMQVKKPEGWNGEAETFIVNADKFNTICGAIASYNEDIYFEKDSTMLIIGVEGKVKTPIELEAEAPQGFSDNEMLFNIMTSGASLTNLIHKGLAFASPNNGKTANAILNLRRSEGVLKGYSTDGIIIGMAEEKAKFLTSEGGNEQVKALVDKMEASLDAYCADSKQNKESFNVLLPAKAVKNLESIIKGQKGVAIAVDKSKVLFQIENKVIYTVVQGKTLGASPEMIEKFLKAPANVLVGCDGAQLVKAVDFVNAINGLNAKPGETRIIISEDGSNFKLVAGVGEQIESVVKATAFNGAVDTIMSVDGTKFKAGVTALSKGNVVIASCENIVTLYNGTLEETDAKNVIGVCQVITQPSTGDEPEASEE